MAVYSLLKGRIGNILFEIATGFSLAKKLNTTYYAVYHDSGKEYVSKYQNNILKKVDFVDKAPPDAFYYKEPQFFYIPIEVPDNKHIVLDGFFQSEKYFDINAVRDLFDINGDWAQSIYSEFGDLLTKNPISINVRRGDYLAHPKQHPACEIVYFKDAMKKIGEDKIYLITSDDTDWCKKKFKGANFHVLENLSAWDGIAVQAMCSGNIMSNSTYSWWGAWLNNHPDKRVIYPEPWFGISYAHLDTKDLIPENWQLQKRKVSISRYFKKAYLKVVINNLLRGIFYKSK